MDYRPYIDEYFLRSLDTLRRASANPLVTYQVFQKNSWATLCGIEKVLELFRDRKVQVHYLSDGSEIEAYDPVMHITGPIQDIIDLETIYLGILSRATKVASNVRRIRKVTGKRVLFFSARFDLYTNQDLDGYAAYTGGVDGASTDAQARVFGQKGVGTMPHALIACYGGDVAQATLAYARYTEGPVVALVDFNNDCVGDSIRTARVLREHGYTLDGVRLDTAASMIDRSLWEEMGYEPLNGVSKELVWKVRRALDREGYNEVRIYVSGSFDEKKVREFEEDGVPVDGYGIGSYFFRGNYDFTSDIVRVEGRDMAKKGRFYKPIGEEAQYVMLGY